MADSQDPEGAENSSEWVQRGRQRVLVEVERVLDRPRLRRRVDPGLAQLYMATIRRIAATVTDPAPIGAATRDAEDDYLVALAREHGVDWIVTGDKDLSHGRIKRHQRSRRQPSRSC